MTGRISNLKAIPVVTPTLSRNSLFMLLIQNAFAALSERANVSAGACWRRLEKMRAAGIIQGQERVIDWAALGYAVQVSLRVTLDKTQRLAFDEFIRTVLPAPLYELRFVIEEIKMRGGSGAVDVNDTFGFWCEVWIAGCEWTLREFCPGQLSRSHGREGNSSQSDLTITEEMTAREVVELSLVGIRGIRVHGFWKISSRLSTTLATAVQAAREMMSDPSSGAPMGSVARALAPAAS